MGKDEQVMQEFIRKVNELETKYIEMISRLMNVPSQIPKAQFVKDKDRIMKRMEDKMTQLGIQFKENMNRITDEFITKMAE